MYARQHFIFSMSKQTSSPKSFKQKAWTVVFEAKTPAGKIFDISLLAVIVASVVIVI